MCEAEDSKKDQSIESVTPPTKVRGANTPNFKELSDKIAQEFLDNLNRNTLLPPKENNDK
ncbi:hypothetical protein ACWWD9_08245 [Methylovorus sp. SPW-M1]